MNHLLTHFGFLFHPFGRRTPKKAIFRHFGFEEAFHRLLISVELDGIAVLIAEAGCGKSLLLGELAGELQDQGWLVHYFAHTTIGPFSLVNVLARKAGIAPRRSRGETSMAIAEKFIEDERKHLIVLDEVHDMPDHTLGDVRLLTIGDFDRKSPFLLLLAGQAHLDNRLADPTHHALDQRISTFARLPPLSPDETSQYLLHRLAAAGASKQPIFDDGSITAIYEASNGVPRRINNIATGALIVAATRNRRTVSAQDVHDATLDRGRS